MDVRWMRLVAAFAVVMELGCGKSDPRGGAKAEAEAKAEQGAGLDCPQLRRPDPKLEAEAERELEASTAQYERDAARMVERIDRAAEVEVVGVVDPLGPVVMGAEDDMWTLSFAFAAWRLNGGAVDRRVLFLDGRERLTDARVEAMRRVVRPYAVLRVKARLDPETLADPMAPRIDAVRALEISPVVDDAELSAAAAALREPVAIRDPMFGELALDRSLDQLVGKRSSGGLHYELSIGCGRCGPGELVVADRVRLRVQCIERDIPVVLAAVTDELYDIYAGGWLSLGGLSRSGFQKRLTLDAMDVDPDGSATIYFDDGGLFLGHVVRVLLTSDGVILGAAIEG